MTTISRSPQPAAYLHQILLRGFAGLPADLAARAALGGAGLASILLASRLMAVCGRTSSLLLAVDSRQDKLWNRSSTLFGYIVSVLVSFAAALDTPYVAGGEAGTEQQINRWSSQALCSGGLCP